MQDLDPPWRAAIAEGLRRYPGDANALSEHVRIAIEAGARPAHAEELVLAWAVAAGDPSAIARFDREVAGDVEAAARKVDRDATFLTEVAQRVRVRLLVAEDRAAPRIAGYRGTGPLRGWVGIAAHRVALNLRRERLQTSTQDLLAEVVDREPDPELRHLKTMYRAEYREAIVAAIGAVPQRSRVLLRLRFVDGLELAAIARLYNVHESTASRWIAQTVAEVGELARRQLIARLAIGPTTANSVARMIASQLDLSIARLLK